MKKKTQQPQPQAESRQLLSDFEGQFIGNGTDNNSTLIAELKGNVFAKGLLSAYKHNENGLIFDLQTAGQVIFLQEQVIKKSENGVKFEQSIRPQISFMSSQNFAMAERKRLFGNYKITVLHNPNKPFKTVEGETAQVQDKFITILK